VCNDVGIDIVPVGRISSLIRDYGDRFLNRWFTAAEIEYCNAKAVPSRHFAARFAAKEAVAKVLPAQWDSPLPWRLIEVVSNRDGALAVRLSGSALEVAERAGVGDIRLSLSHCDEYATAIALSRPGSAESLRRVDGDEGRVGHA
jgi:holo-[acyl-carrier protein] synthase